MAPRNTEYSDWQVNYPEIKMRSAHLLRSHDWTDCTFRFEMGAGDSSGVGSLDAHKLILAMASPVFAAMFYGRVGNHKKGPVYISDIEQETFGRMLDYIYTDEVEISSSELAIDLFRAANKYILVHLEKTCMNYLFNKLDSENVCHLYEFSVLFEERELTKKCLEIFSTQTLQVLRGNSFKDAQIDTLIKIYSMDYLNIDNELDLHHALVKYSKKMLTDVTQAEVESNQDDETCCESRCEVDHETPKRTKDKDKNKDKSKRDRKADDQTSRNNEYIIRIKKKNKKCKNKKNKNKKNSEVDDQSSKSNDHVNKDAEACEKDSATDYQNTKNNYYVKKESKHTGACCQCKSGVIKVRKDKLSEVMKYVRYLTLTPAKFAECDDLHHLITKEEAYALCMNISSTKTQIPMPDGFSASRLPRREGTKGWYSWTERITVHIDFCNLKILITKRFNVSNIPWKLEINPSDLDKKTDDGFVPDVIEVRSICLLNSESKSSWKLNTEIGVKVIPQIITNIALPSGTSKGGTISMSRRNYITRALFSRETLEDPSFGLTKNDTVVFEVSVATEELEV